MKIQPHLDNRVGLLALLALLASACGSPDDALKISVAFPRLTSPCDTTKLTARLRLPDLDRSCDLVPGKGGFTGTCQVPSAAGTSVVLEYLHGSLVLARAAKRTVLAAGTTISFSVSDLIYDDDDGDGIKNIDEFCLGRNPGKKDAPSFSGGLISEQGSVAAANKIFVIGERIKLTGERIPAAEHLELRIGPLLGQAASETLAIKPREVSPTSVELQIPPGLDTSKDVTLHIKALGLTWTRTLTVSRLWTAITRGTPSAVIYHHGSYTKPSSYPKAVTLTNQGLSCSYGCVPRIWSITADGRQVVVHYTNEGTGVVNSGDLFVLDLVTGKLWSSKLLVDPRGGAQLMDGDRHLALLDATKGTISLRAFDAEQRTLGAAATDQQTIKGAQAMICSELEDSRLYVYVKGAADDELREYRVKAGKLGAAVATVKLKGTCPGTACRQVSLHEAAKPGQVLVARDDLDRVELVDLTATSVASLLMERPEYLEVPPRSRDRVLIGMRPRMGNPLYLDKVQLCDVELGSGFGVTTPVCGYTSRKNTQLMPMAITVVPEETGAYMTTGGLLDLVVLYYDLKSKKLDYTSNLSLDHTSSNVMVQP